MNGSISALESLAAPGGFAPGFGVKSFAYRCADGAIFAYTILDSAVVGRMQCSGVAFTLVFESGGVVTRGRDVKVDATGRVIDQGGIGVKFGIARSAAAGPGSMVEVLVDPA